MKHLSPKISSEFDEYTRGAWANLLYDAYLVAKESPDPSTQCAALLYNPHGDLISAEINQFPRDVAYLDERWERPLKYKIIEHAERNSIYAAANKGLSTDNATMIAPWAACADCARGIIQSGTTRLVRHLQASQRSPEFWIEEIQVADQMLKEASVEVIDVDWTFEGSGLEIRHSGEVWQP